MSALTPIASITVAATLAVALLIRRSRRSPTSSAAATGTLSASALHSQSPLVIVVGLGGVGSHAAHLLLRGGVRRLRLIDFDQVTLSSLNRHASAAREDVGTPKVRALREYLLRVAPSADIEAIVALYDAPAAACLLAGEPALVVDCIDDLATKAALLGHCVREGLPVLSALGAGGKGDCCAFHVGRLSEVFDDPIARSLLKRLRKSGPEPAPDAAAASAEVLQPGGGGGAPGGGQVAWWEEMCHRVPVVYSSEAQQVGLLPLPAGAAASEIGSQASFRVRVMPVLPPLPAAMGAALAAHALSRLADEEVRRLWLLMASDGFRWLQMASEDF